MRTSISIDEENGDMLTFQRFLEVWMRDFVQEEFVRFRQAYVEFCEELLVEDKQYLELQL